MKQILVLANERQRSEWLQKLLPRGAMVKFAVSLNDFYETEADIYFHLDTDENEIVSVRTTKPVFVNSVIKTLGNFPANTYRLNAWNEFFGGDIVEIVSSEGSEGTLSEIMHELNWKYQLVPDIPGMIAARTVSMIINEAFFAWGEHISSRKEIDISMRLGTNYPFGPFEWADKIGLKKIYTLLEELSKTDSRYTIAPALRKEVLDRLV